MLIDTHAHLDYPDFQQDFEAVLERASQAGVQRIITIGTSVESSRRAVALAEQYPQVYAVVGVHPTSAMEAESDIITPLRALAASKRVVAIGETGLDYHHLPSRELEKSDAAKLAPALQNETPSEIIGAIEDGAHKDAQASIFEQQLDLACELGLNVVIHQREAWEDTLAMLSGYNGRLRGVFHCFGGTLDQAEALAAHGHLVSFTGIVTFKNAQAVQDTASNIAAYMVETDCPYLAPVPFRGKRCEPAHTRQVAEKIAELRGQSLEQVACETTATAEAFFRFQP